MRTQGLASRGDALPDLEPFHTQAFNRYGRLTGPKPKGIKVETFRIAL